MDRFGRDRSQFHLMRAQAHLLNDDPSRALRHLHKCKFGMRGVYQQPPGLGTKPPPPALDWATLRNEEHEAAIEERGGRAEVNKQQALRHAALRAQFDRPSPSSFGGRRIPKPGPNAPRAANLDVKPQTAEQLRYQNLTKEAHDKRAREADTQRAQKRVPWLQGPNYKPPGFGARQNSKFGASPGDAPVDAADAKEERADERKADDRAEVPANAKPTASAKVADFKKRYGVSSAKLPE